jgi:hypothetical protein
VSALRAHFVVIQPATELAQVKVVMRPACTQFSARLS